MLSGLPTALCLLLISTCVDALPGVLILNNDPAPPPDKGPPASANASRDKAHLPAEICGIVGGYVLTVLIWGVLLLTVGRRMRRKTENSPKTLEIELANARPAGKSLTSPQSARSATSWLKKSFKKNPGINSTVASPTSPVVQSPNSFDQKIIEADRERNQVEMERLYAAVMDHDRKKSYSQVSTAEQEEVTELNENRPSKVSTSGRPGGTAQSTPGSPRSPMKAIYPPGYNNGPPTAPLPRYRPQRDERPASPRSILSKKSHQSTGSSSSKTRFNLKNLRISGPIQKYPGESSHDEARSPLSPRFYNPGAPPSPPTQQNSPTSVDEAYEQLDEVQPLPRPAPQRAGSYADSPTSTSGPQGNKSAASSTHTLPLRGYAEPLKSPELKTTYVDRRMDKLSMTTPKTGVPYTPYSPYMPFTPVTPVTPHLITKKERKGLKKMNGRKMAREGDLVQSPKEIFGDAY